MLNTLFKIFSAANAQSDKIVLDLSAGVFTFLFRQFYKLQKQHEENKEEIKNILKEFKNS